MRFAYQPFVQYHHVVFTDSGLKIGGRTVASGELKLTRATNS